MLETAHILCNSFYLFLSQFRNNTSGINLYQSNRIVNCKAFFNDGGGFLSTGSRITYSACESQDNGFIGFGIRGNYTIASGCIADSNEVAGFWLKSNTGFMAGLNLMGFASFGRDNSSQSKDFNGQQHGILLLDTELRSSVISGVARENCAANLTISNSVILEAPDPERCEISGLLYTGRTRCF